MTFSSLQPLAIKGTMVERTGSSKFLGLNTSETSAGPHTLQSQWKELSRGCTSLGCWSRPHLDANLSPKPTKDWLRASSPVPSQCGMATPPWLSGKPSSRRKAQNILKDKLHPAHALSGWGNLGDGTADQWASEPVRRTFTTAFPQPPSDKWHWTSGRGDTITRHNIIISPHHTHYNGQCAIPSQCAISTFCKQVFYLLLCLLFIYLC